LHCCTAGQINEDADDDDDDDDDDDEQVFVEPRTSTVNMTLHATAAWAWAAVIDRQLAACGAGSCRSITAAHARAQQQTSRTSLLLSIDRTDRRTDIRPLHRPCTAYYPCDVNE